MKLNPHLNFNGQCAAAFEFYVQRLGAKPVFSLSYKDSPMADQFPAECSDQIMHATIEIGGVLVMGADSPPGYYVQPNGFCISLAIDDPVEAERIFDALAENGTVNMPLQQTFWAVRFGMLTDQFGIPWMVNCSDPSVAG